jgi:hypothetical protein
MAQQVRRASLTAKELLKNRNLLAARADGVSVPTSRLLPGNLA